MEQISHSKSRFMAAFEKAITVAIVVGFVFLGFTYYSHDSAKKAPSLPNHSMVKIFNLR